MNNEISMSALLQNKFSLLVLSCVASLAACDKGTVPAAPAVATAPITQPLPASGVAGKPVVMSMQEGLALAQKNNCLTCHAIDKKLLGPAWTDVSRRYIGAEGIDEKLVAKISLGGGGSWGNTPMPPMALAVKEEDIRALVKFILDLPK